jgi:hypothetical protein
MVEKVVQPDWSASISSYKLYFYEGLQSNLGVTKY